MHLGAQQREGKEDRGQAVRGRPLRMAPTPRRIRDPTALVDDLFELLCEVPAIGAPPGVIPGSLPALAGVGLATLLCALAPAAAWRRWRRRAL